MKQATRHQVLIASYRRDFIWLKHCLRSLEKFSRDFMSPVIAVPAEDHAECYKLVQQNSIHAHVEVWNGPGFGRAQDAMMTGDQLCPHADYVWLLGSDCLATKSFSPADYCDAEGKPIMLYHSWEHMKAHAPEAYFWRAGVEKAFGWESKGEFMRRLPLAYPCAMLAPMREFIAKRHSMPFNGYVWHNVNKVRNFSESNVMGEWAWRHAQDAYNWICLDNNPAPAPATGLPITQFWSHGGLDHPRGDGKTPRAVITEVLGSCS